MFVITSKLKNYFISFQIYLYVSGFFIITSNIFIILMTIPEVASDPDQMKIYQMIEFICGIWFLVEVFVRIFAHPSVPQFFKSPINVMELLLSFLFFVFIIPHPSQLVHNLRNVSRALRMISLMRLLKNTTTIRSLSTTLERSKTEILSYLFYFWLAVLIFASICFGFENSEPRTQFVSIPGIFLL